VIIYRCKECGWICRGDLKSAIGTAHANAEKHASVWKFPAWMFPVANPDVLGRYIEELHVTVNQVSRENVKKNPCEVESE